MPRDVPADIRVSELGDGNGFAALGFHCLAFADEEAGVVIVARVRVAVDGVVAVVTRGIVDWRVELVVVYGLGGCGGEVAG